MDTNSPLISVVIPTYNRSKLLPRAIQSVLAQSYSHLEVIVVDDASSDDTQTVVAALGDKRIRYLRHATKKGGSAARNTGIEAAKGEFLAFLDDDDEWLSEKLTRQLQAAQQTDSNQPAVIYTGAQYVAPDGRIMRITQAEKQGGILSELLYGNYVGSTSKVFVSRRAVLESGGFDASLQSCQDWDLWIRLALAYPYIAIADPLVKRHVQHGERIDSNLPAQIQGRLRLLEKIRPHLASISWRQRRRILANHYLMLAGHYASHIRKTDALKWATRSCTLNPLNWRSWFLLTRILVSQ